MEQPIPIVMDNIVFSLQRMGGASVYWGNLLSSLSDDADFRLMALERPDALGNEVRKGLSLPEGSLCPDKNVHFRIAQFAHADSPLEGSLFHSSCYRTTRTRGCTNITTVHDFIWQYYTTGMNRRIHVGQIARAVRESKAIICVSASTRDDLLEIVPESRDLRIEVIHNGYDSDAYRYEEKERRPQVAFIGGRGGYKNFSKAVEAVSLCDRVALKVIGSPLSDRERSLLEARVPGRFESVVYPSAEEVCSIYQQSVALLYLSEYEGFGIPLLEGMASGVPVIATRRSSIPEVAGDACVLLDDNSPESVAQEIRRLLDDPAFFRDRVAAGLERVGDFSWEKCAARTRSFYKAVWAEL